MWISPEFKVYVVREFQRLKAKEQEQIGWTAKRELSKINYRIHTDAIKSNLIPEEVTREQANIIYAEEADGIRNHNRKVKQQQHCRLSHVGTVLPADSCNQGL